MKLLHQKTAISFYFILPLVVFLLGSCHKYLDEKSDKRLVVPSTILDAQLLTNEPYFAAAPSVSLAMDDNMWILDAYFDTRDVNFRAFYTWDKGASTSNSSWSSSYTGIRDWNVALETLAKINPSPAELLDYNRAKGSALFLRAYQYFGLMVDFTPQYQKSSASQTLGIPFKNSSNINENPMRSNLEESYQQILSDIKLAASLLPNTSAFPSQPTKPGAFATLARIYLTMNDYTNALAYSDSCLQLFNTLMDYNNYTPSGTITPFKRYVPEDIFHNMSYGNSAFFYPRANIDSNLYSSYDVNDLRKTIFFVKNTNGANTYSFRGLYDQNTNVGPFGGLATDEVYLIRAECYARTGNVQSAMNDLNTLLVKRWKKGTFIPFTAANQQAALDLILTERRKELVMRHPLRWLDLKRLNLDPRYAKTLTRIVKGQTYTLPPNDPRYVLLIPQEIINLSGIQQNPR